MIAQPIAAILHRRFPAAPPGSIPRRRSRRMEISGRSSAARLSMSRKQLVREQTRHVQRIEKTLAEANIKLNSVISDIMGASGRRMIEAMIKGVRQPRQLAELAGKQIKATPKELYDALHRVRDRLRHEPLSNRWAPRLLVRAVSRAKRKR